MVQKMDLIDLRYVVPLIEAGGVMPFVLERFGEAA